MEITVTGLLLGGAFFVVGYAISRHLARRSKEKKRTYGALRP